MNMNIQHRNGAARILHFLYGRGGSGAHLNEIAEACGLSYQSTVTYLTGLGNSHFNTSLSRLIHRAGYDYRDHPRFVENRRGMGLWRISDHGRDLYLKIQFQSPDWK